MVATKAVVSADAADAKLVFWKAVQSGVQGDIGLVDAMGLGMAVALV